MNFDVGVANESHYQYAEAICELIAVAAKARGTGIAKREAEYIQTKMREGKAIIALQAGNLAGFCYIETWGHNKYVANSGLIVAPEYRGYGLAKNIKRNAFELSRKKYPDARLFGITTSLAVMKINSQLGYKPVTFSELTDDEVFWKGCQSCPNYDVLARTGRKLCLCTGMMFDPVKGDSKEPVEEVPMPTVISQPIIEEPSEDELKNRSEALKQRWQQYKTHLRKRGANKVLQKIKEGLFHKK